MSSNKKQLLKSLLSVNAGCGCSRPKLSDAYEPQPKPRKTPSNNALPTIENDGLTSTSFSFDKTDPISSSFAATDHLHSESESELPDLQTLPKAKLGRHCPKIVNSIAVVKDSNDPYKDFRHSMLQMIVEKRIYSESDLGELLRCFLELNSRCHHRVIVEAFTEIRDRVLTLQDQEARFVHGGQKSGS
ncbi:hypothetical protein V6N13_000755 [Hibiscus sabdariffa]|uniref:Transcription repressor n=1 Tax=Hibiscus sabdariffa TaxID=183260 RepID=A0ABR2G699_9ROSI